MWKKILYSLLTLFALILAVGGFLYWRMTENSKPPISDKDRARLTVMPLPAKVTLAEESLFIDTFHFHFKVNRDTRVENTLSRMLKVLDAPGNETKTEGEANLIIDFHHDTDSIQRAFEDEAYTIAIDDKSIRLTSENAYGILRGLETLKQLAVNKDNSVAFIQGTMEDRPRYPWRGIMIDVGRHFIPKEIILRNLDAMAAVKLNVLHWHLSEYQGFRIESKVYPKLHELGSNGSYYTQEDVKEVIAYARDRGIRVVPEFDMPGHATSWFVGYPELATTYKQYVPDIRFGVLKPVMDPTRESVYVFLDKFIGEMAGLFPDEYFHIGGDEVSPEEWNSSDSVQLFMRKNGIRDAHGLQQYFNKRVTAIARKYNKIVMGWDEVLYPGADTTMVVHAWRGGRKLWEAAQAGHPTILSAGYYLDHKLPAGKHYQVDPEIIPGAVAIKPDSIHWKEWKVKLSVSESPMDANLVLYGEGPDLRGVFNLMESASGIEKATIENGNLEFSFPSDYGTINVAGKVTGDSLNGTMSLSLLSFPLKGSRISGDDMPGTKAPVFEQIKPLTDYQRKKIIGGEAAMWTEFVSADNIDSRVWPRSAAIAEKLWSPQVLTKNVDDMYRRLGVLDEYLHRLGIWHHKGQDQIISKWNLNPEDETVWWFLNNVEEVKYYQRFTSFQSFTTLVPLDQVVDAAQPESLEAHNFNQAVTKFVNDSSHMINEKLVHDYLENVSNNHVAFEALAKDHPALQKVIPLSLNLSEMAKLGISELARIAHDQANSEKDRTEKLRKIEDLSVSLEGVEIAITPGIKALITCE